MPSLEQTEDFQLLRRVLRAIAPDYVLYTHLEMLPGATSLDIEKKTIVIADRTDIVAARAIALFQIGQLRFPLERFVQPNPNPTELEQIVAVAMRKRDTQAANWAVWCSMALWPDQDIEVLKSTVRSLTSTQFEWLRFLRE
jgi:hypothetical protein